MQQTNIKARLLGLIIFPILVIVALSAGKIHFDLKNKENLETTKQRIKEAQTLANVIHFMQIERGLSVGFIARGNIKDNNKLLEVRSNVDSAIQEAKRVLQANEVSGLTHLRSSVDTLSIDKEEVHMFFTNSITNMLNVISMIPGIIDSKDARNAIQASTHLASAKEALGQIRANLNVAFILNSFKDDSYFIFGGSIGAYNINTYKFLHLAPKEIVESYKQNDNQTAVLKTFSIVKKAQKVGLKGNFNIDSSEWFFTATTSIDILRNVEKELYEFINKTIEEEINNTSSNITMLAIGLAAGIVLFAFFMLLLIKISITKPLDEFEAGLVEEKEQAERESHMKSSFLAVMSHEIRTPLNGIMPYVELLLQTKLSREQSEYLHVVHKSGESLLRVINDILDFSKIESGKLDIEEISFNAVKEFESIVDLYTAKAKEKEIEFCVFVDPTIPSYLYGDPTRIKQILSNLLSNAIKFTDVGGEIEFFVVLKSIDQETQKATLNISVKDSGRGISKENLAHIFTPFSQEDNSISRRYGGTGLGLSISQDLSKMMHGEISVASEVGKGSIFSLSIELPIVDTCEVQFDSSAIKSPIIGVLTAKEEVRKCATVLNRYFDAFGFKFKHVHNQSDADDCDVLFVISTGRDLIPWINSDFCSKKRVVAIIPSKAENANKFKSHTSIQIPINGSKIYDAIIESDKVSHYYAQKQSNIGSKKYNAKVLLAEDNPTNQKVALALLKKFNIEVVIANDGQEAVDSYISLHKDIDLIFMDIHMPILDGLEATKHIREFETLHSLAGKTIIALTADAIKGHIQVYMDAGMNDYLSKPIELEKFNKMIEKHLSHKEVKSEDTHDLDIDYDIDVDDVDFEALVKEINDEDWLNDNLASKIKQIEKISQSLDLDIETSEIIYNEFQSNWEELKVKLDNAIEQCDYDLIRSIAHQLKGACGSVRFDEASDIAKELEITAREQAQKTDILIYRELFLKLVVEVEKD